MFVQIVLTLFLKCLSVRLFQQFPAAHFHNDCHVFSENIKMCSCQTLKLFSVQKFRTNAFCLLNQVTESNFRAKEFERSYSHSKNESAYTFFKATTYVRSSVFFFLTLQNQSVPSLAYMNSMSSSLQASTCGFCELVVSHTGTLSRLPCNAATCAGNLRNWDNYDGSIRVMIRQIHPETFTGMTGLTGM